MLSYEEAKRIYAQPEQMKVAPKTNKNKTKYGFKKATLDKVVESLRGVKVITRPRLAKKSGLSCHTIDKVMAAIIKKGAATKFVDKTSDKGIIAFSIDHERL